MSRPAPGPAGHRLGAGPLALLAALAAGAAAVPTSAGAATVSDVRLKMGSRFEITAVHADRGRAQEAIDRAYAEIDRIEASISSWREDSETAEINRWAGRRPVAVSGELFRLIRRALEVTEVTSGAFDITFATFGGLWDFKASSPHLPDPAEVRRRLPAAGAANVVLDEAASTVLLRHPDTRIGFGAIGKGYAANRAVFVLRDAGVSAGVVDAGGDLVAFGRREDGAPWTIGIADPFDHDRVFARLVASDTAVVTSGDYERFVTIDGKRYAHILDPRTGWPVEGLRSVTIVCPDAELADALATGVFVLGPAAGLELIERLHGVEGLLVDRDGRVSTSTGLAARLAAGESLPRGGTR